MSRLVLKVPVYRALSINLLQKWAYRKSTMVTPVSNPPCQFSTSTATATTQDAKPVSSDVVSLKELLELMKNRDPQAPNYHLIDVRGESERKQGMIPTSIWLPLDQIEALFKLGSEDFNALLKMKKFSKDDNIIFHCKSGRRSGMAQKIVQDLGYHNARNYSGSWDEFSREHPELVEIDPNLQ